MSTLPELSDQDKAVLNSIFNPSLPLGEGIFENEFTATDSEDDNEGENCNTGYNEIKELELMAIHKAENENYEEALELFNKCVEMNPMRSATYNNRAQVHQLNGNIDASLSDLAKTIELTGEKGKICSQALCQRGVIYRKDQKEELAREDFKKAAALGSAFAKQQLIEMNPYAALCNQMLSQVMQKLQ